MDSITLQNLIQLISFIGGFFIAWYFYRKQNKQLNDRIYSLEEKLLQCNNLSQEQLFEKRLEKAEQYHKKLGTPKQYINSLLISEDEKSKLWSTHFEKIKGRKPKRNPFKCTDKDN